MYLFRCPTLNPTAANIDKEVARWCWLPDGRCNSFTKGAILLFAPPTSGVYGLFNSDCQVFIGESANIQEALLRHESEPDFQSQHLQPTGFTFEPCAAELRKSKADELIAKFHPVLQTEAVLTETWSATNDPRVSEAGLGRHEKTYSDHQQFPLHEREKESKVRRHFYFKRTHATALAAMFVTSVIGAGFRAARERYFRYVAAAVKSQGLRWLCGPGRGERTKLLSRASRVLRLAREGGISAPVVDAPRGLSGRVSHGRLSHCSSNYWKPRQLISNTSSQN